MKIKLIALIIVLLVSSVLIYYWQKYDKFLENGKDAPMSTKVLDDMENKGVENITLKNIQGESISLYDFKGKVIILNFWASWCEPCVQEFPSMQKLVDHFKGDVVIFAVSHDNDEADLKNFLKAFKAEKQQKERTISIVWDQDRTIANRFAIEALPESFIIGVDMKLIRKVAGSENWYSPEAVAYFTNLLK